MLAKILVQSCNFLEKIAIFVAVLAAVPLAVRADAVDVNYTVNGASGAWVLNFSVANNVNGQYLYFFGVLLSAQDIVNSPAGSKNCFDQCTQTTLNPTNLGNGVGSTGPGLNYNNLWINFAALPVGGIASGNSLSGFEVQVDTAAPPVSVDWFAFTADFFGTSPYTGGQNFSYTGDCEGAFGETCAEQGEVNPLFAGTSAIATPEPATLLMIGVGLLGLAVGKLWGAGKRWGIEEILPR